MRQAILLALVSAFLGGFALVVPARGADEVKIVCPAEASRLEMLAAREVRRYLYLRTGKLLDIAAAPAQGEQIVIAMKGRKVLETIGLNEQVRRTFVALAPQQYAIQTQRINGHRSLFVVGEDEVATLWAGYRLAEQFGVWFDLDGDVIPDRRIELKLPEINEQAKPLFPLRGIQPFHDFPEGPDWWTTSHYKAVLSQLPKLRMNFFGLHTYPEGGVGPEPAVWIGRPQDVGPDGSPRFSFVSSWQNTLRGNWGYEPRKTGEWSFGASRLFEQDGFGSDVMLGHTPRPATPEASKEIFDRAGKQLKAAFEHARSLGIKTCVGTETPLIVPKAVQQRLKEAGVDPKSATQSLYEGIFLRIMRTYPIDYYWFWTPEGWTWEGTKEAQVKATIDDLNAAIAAARKVNAPFTLATCGWVLGPQNDRSLFDKVLPREMPLSCINRQVGKEKVEPGFANVKGRGKWAIPWLEDDPNLCAPQLWVGRMRKDAADALQYGCDGLMGIHWRTRIISPNAVALAKAAWGSGASPVSPVNTENALGRDARATLEGPEGGQFAPFPHNKITDTAEPTIYQTVRYNVDAYRFSLPKGKYGVTLKFCEPHYAEKEKRVFGVKLQGRAVIDRLDIFEKVGRNKALDYTFNDVDVKDGWLDIDFVRIVEFPSIAGIVIQGNGVTKKINCGGSAWNGYAADWPASAGGAGGVPKDRYLPSDDFYAEWAGHQFGPEAADAIAKVFSRIDGHLPEPTGWIHGPGGITPDPKHWNEMDKLYAFVPELEALRPRVKGTSNLARYDYWLNSFRYMRAVERVRWTWWRYNEAMKLVLAEKDVAAKAKLAEAKALPIRKELIEAVGEVYTYLLATVTTPGEMGTIANWAQHIEPGLLIRPGLELAKILGKDLPPDAQPTPAYRGPVRLIVPTVRTTLSRGEPLEIKAMVLSPDPMGTIRLYHRPLGQGGWSSANFARVARGVYTITLPPPSEDIEYYIEAHTINGTPAVFPAAAPALAQTVVIAP